MKHALLPNSKCKIFIGRKQQQIKGEIRLDIDQNLADMGDGVLPQTMVISQTYKLFVGGNLFASVMLFPHQKYSRAPVRLIKSKRSRSMEIHLVKKYITLH